MVCLAIALLQLGFHSCSDADDEDSGGKSGKGIPSVTTVSCVKDLTISANRYNYRAVIKITDEGASEVTKKGVCFGTTAECTKKSTGIIDSDAGQYKVLIMELSGKTKYYVKAFATNSKGTGYGKVISFTTP